MVGGRLVPIRIGLVLGGALLVVLALIESLWVAIVAVQANDVYGEALRLHKAFSQLGRLPT
jgi:hypothetical protein